MRLASGSKLGPYEIKSALGAGGMGEVYRATDTRLDRTVAIKVLASHLSDSPELRQRFEREARAISSLNHPLICQLYDIGSQDGTDYLVMEFLEGETLAARLEKGALPLNEVLRLGAAIAEALAVAHRQGIVHRDLKPANIMLVQGRAKLMDFGLAKPVGVSGSGVASGQPPAFSATVSLNASSPLSPLTTVGTVVGTIQYMSPEQIEGKEADARSDIFALGAMLYEMATGRRAFEGKTQLSLASAILEKEPEPLAALKPMTPASFGQVVNTCLRKNPEDRFQAAQDVRLALEWIAAEKPAPVSAATPMGTKERMGWAAAVLGTMVVSALAGIFFFHHPPPPASSIRTVINPPGKTNLNLSGDFAGPPVLSPDGSSIAFTATASDGKTSIWIRPLNSLEASPLPDTEGAVFPFWSPDSHSLGFFAESKLKTIELGSSSSQAIADAPFGRGGAWGAGGVILFSPNTQTGLMRVNAGGGPTEPATTLDVTRHSSHRWPQFLPDGKHYLYLAIHHDPSRSANDTLYYASVDGKENRPLFSSHANALYADGFLLFARADQMMAQPFDPASGALSGAPKSLLKGVANDISTWHMDASVAENGLLIWGTGGTADWELVWMDRSGKQIGAVGEKLENLQQARISPQGDRIALQLNNAQADIWVMDVARGVRTRLTFGPVANQGPVWSPDGKWIAYATDRNGHANIYRKSSDGSGSEELLLSDERQVVPEDWSRDGKFLIYSRGVWGANWEIWALPLEGGGKPYMVSPQARSYFIVNGRLSPDSRWLIYASNESGTNEVYVAGMKAGQGKWQISTNGGGQGSWSKDGKELYYLDLNYTLYGVPVKEVGGALQFGAQQALVKNWSAPQVFYDVSADGKEILLDRVSLQVGQAVNVMTNFTAALNK